MKKFLSVLLAMLMVVAMIPTVFAADTPVITTTASKTSISVGDIVIVSVLVSKNSKLCALTYELSYSTDEFAYVADSATTNGVFSSEAVNATVAGKIKYVGAVTTQIGDEKQTFLTFKLKALKSNAKIKVNITEAYVSTGTSSETNVTSAVASASTSQLTFTAKTNYIDIRTPSKTTIRCKDGIVLYADVKTTLPSGAKIEWTADNDNFKMKVADDKKSCTITSENDGTTIFTVTLRSASGTVLETETIEIDSQAGFFDKIGGFFRMLFGATKVYDK